MSATRGPEACLTRRAFQPEAPEPHDPGRPPGAVRNMLEQRAEAVVTTRGWQDRRHLTTSPKIDANWFGSDPVTPGRIMIPAVRGPRRGRVVGAVRLGGSLRILINDLKDRGKQHANETCR